MNITSSLLTTVSKLVLMKQMKSSSLRMLLTKILRRFRSRESSKAEKQKSRTAFHCKAGNWIGSAGQSIKRKNIQFKNSFSPTSLTFQPRLITVPLWNVTGSLQTDSSSLLIMKLHCLSTKIHCCQITFASLPRRIFRTILTTTILSLNTE